MIGTLSKREIANILHALALFNGGCNTGECKHFEQPEPGAKGVSPMTAEEVEQLSKKLTKPSDIRIRSTPEDLIVSIDGEMFIETRGEDGKVTVTGEELKELLDECGLYVDYEHGDVICDKCGDVYADCADGYCGLCPECADEEDEDEEDEEDADEPGLCVDCGAQCYLDGSLAVLCPKCDGPEAKTSDILALDPTLMLVPALRAALEPYGTMHRSSMTKAQLIDAVQQIQSNLRRFGQPQKPLGWFEDEHQ